MGKYIGIDLGTTFSCMAFIDEDGIPKIIPNEEGDDTTPSVVLFEEDETVIGKEAKSQSVFNPGACEQFIKRQMGRRDYSGNHGGEKYSPECISAMILSKLKKDAEKYLGEEVKGAVITVPAYFSEPQKKATIDAGKIAGLEVLALINEPTAAALAYGISKTIDESQNIMVFDLGGGTFDATIMCVEKENITVLATDGDRQLGGYDFDNKIIQEVILEAKEQGLDIEEDLQARQNLQIEAEKAKKTLSTKKKTNIVLNVEGKPFRYVLTREYFEELIEPLLYRTEASMERACDEAGIEYSDLSKILLVGGSTRIPLVCEFIKQVTDITPSSEVHSDQAVAIGAAWYVTDCLKRKIEENANKENEENKEKIIIPETKKQYSFVDVTSHGIGIVCHKEEKINSVILPKNSKVPAVYTHRYKTMYPYQETMNISVTQGEDRDLRYVTIIGNASIEIEPRDRIIEVDVTVSCDESSVIHVTVVDVDLQKNLGEIHIERISNLTEKEIKENKARISKLNITGEDLE